MNASLPRVARSTLLVFVGGVSAGAWADEDGDEVVVRGGAPEVTEPGTTAVDPASVARPGDGLEDVLATVPGVRIQRLGGLGAFAGISLRGSGFRQTVVRLDGVPLNPDGVEAVDLSRWPLAGLARVDVTRGRPSATVGAAPIGGVVDLWTHADGAPLVVDAALGAFGSARSSVSGGGRWDGGDVLLAGDVLQTAGTFPFVDDGGTLYDDSDDRVRRRDNNARSQVSGLARVRVGDGRRQGTVLASAAHRLEGLPGPIGRPQQGAALRTDRVLVSAGGEGVVGSGRVSGRLWGRWRGEELRDPAGELGLADSSQQDHYLSVGAQLSGEGALHPRVGLRGSVDLRREGFWRVPGAVEPGRQEARWGLGAAVDLPWRPTDAWEVVPGVDVRTLQPEGGSTEPAVAALPGLVVRVRPSAGVAAWVSGTGAFRPADLTELFGNQGALRGNPDLRPERAWKVEVGARAEGEGVVSWSVEGAGFVTWAQDAIGWLQNTQRTLVAVNFGQTRTAGGELGAGLDWRERLGVQGSASWMDARQTTPDPTRLGRPVPFVAPWRGWGRLWGAPVPWWRVGVDGDSTASVPVDPQGLIRQPPRHLLGVFTSVTLPGGAWSLSLDVHNVLDARTGPVDLDPVGGGGGVRQAPLTDLVGYPLPGRTWWVAVRFAAPRGKEER